VECGRNGVAFPVCSISIDKNRTKTRTLTTGTFDPMKRTLQWQSTELSTYFEATGRQEQISDVLLLTSIINKNVQLLFLQ